MNPNDRVYVMDAFAVARMNYYTEWEEVVAPSMGLRNPWKHRPDQPIRSEEVVSLMQGKPIKGTKLIYPEVEEQVLQEWKAERDKYIELRNAYLCERVLAEFGYPFFEQECETLHREDLLDVYMPCDSEAEPQCSLFCPIYINCARREGDEANAY